MTTNQPISVDLEHGAFCDSKSASIADVWRYGLNPEYWRHGITINQGLGWSVSEVEATKRLNYIRVRLGKALFGNNFRKRAKFTFLMFKQGSREGFNQHYHVLMAVRGDHNWSDEQIAEQSVKLIAIDRKDVGRRMYTSILIGRTVIDFTVTLLVKRRSTQTAS
jgi:hypothetical protein